MWVIGLSGVLSVYLMLSFVISIDMSIGWQVGLYVLSIIIAPILWYLYLKLTKWIASKVDSILLNCLVVFLWGFVLSAALTIAVPIWRAAVDPDQRAMIGYHYLAYTLLSPLLYLMMSSIRILCFRPQRFDFI